MPLRNKNRIEQQLSVMVVQMGGMKKGRKKELLQ